MKRRPRELDIPAAAKGDEKAREMARVWVAQGKLWCALNVGNWSADGKFDEAVAWGKLLADMARHVGNALEESEGRDHREVLPVVSEGFNEELDRPTTDVQGQFGD
jgi:hypothetical protein